MRRTRFALPVLALTMLATAGMTFAQQGYPQQPYPQQQQPNYGPPQQGQPGYGQDRDRDHDRDQNRWDAPPNEMREFARQGFHDGIEGARSDMQNRRRPNASYRPEYRHPNVPRNMRTDYRMGFQRGYNMAIDHAAHENYGPPREQRPY